MNLKSLDYKILDLLSKKDKTYIDEILRAYPDKKYSTLFRIKLLSDQELTKYGRSIPNTSYIYQHYKFYEDPDTHISSCKPTHYYSLTELGKVTLYEYFYNKKRSAFSEFRRMILYPLIVAFITALITSYLSNLYLFK